MAWARTGRAPKKFRVSFEVNAEREPELAKWIWSLQWGKASKTVRDVLSLAAKLNAEKNGESLAEAIKALSSTQSQTSPETREQSTTARPLAKQAGAGKGETASITSQSNELRDPGDKAMAVSAAIAMRELDKQF